MDKRIVESWERNAVPWIRAVREHEIESRRLVTDRAVVDAVVRLSPATVLDLGCGEGWLARELATRGVAVVGIDVVPDLVDAADAMGGGEFRILSYEQIVQGELDVRVDVVVCNFSLIGYRIVDDLVATIPLLLNDGGSLVIQTLHSIAACGELPYRDGWREGSWAGFSDDFRDPAPWYFRTLESWVSTLESSGFGNVEVVEPVFPGTGEPASLILIGSEAPKRDSVS